MACHETFLPGANFAALHPHLLYTLPEPQLVKRTRAPLSNTAIVNFTHGLLLPTTQTNHLEFFWRYRTLAFQSECPLWVKS
jgi:hypothetical protein